MEESQPARDISLHAHLHETGDSGLLFGRYGESCDFGAITLVTAALLRMGDFDLAQKIKFAVNCRGADKLLVEADQRQPFPQSYFEIGRVIESQAVAIGKV